MITPLGQNVLLKKKENEQSIIYIPNQCSDLYIVCGQGTNVEASLVNKCVFVKEGLVSLEHDGCEYFIVNYKNILAVVEE